MELENVVVGILKKVMNVQEFNFSRETNFGDMNLDSLVKVELAIALEDEFSISIDEGEISELNSIKEVVEFLEVKLKDKA